MADTFEKKLSSAVDAVIPKANAFFKDIEKRTKDGPGVTRPPYLEGEQIGHDMVAEWAGELDLETSIDAAGNMYMVYPGEDRDASVAMTGSHMDTVPKGGNYDGAAGVIAGLAALDGFRRAEITPKRDVVLMAIRAEEAGSWFTGKHGGHMGSRAALGMYMDNELETAIHLGTKTSLGEAMANAGFDPDKVANEPPHLKPERIASYTELHIEQGPVLQTEGHPIGIVTGIRGNRRLKQGKVLGEYTHSGAVPQHYRHDAVLAAAEFINRLEKEGLDLIDQGRDLVFSSGIFHTDADVNTLSKVSGQLDFTLDMRSMDVSALDEMQKIVTGIAHDIAEKRGVTFDISDFAAVAPSPMHGDERAKLHEGAKALGIDAIDVASGGGHDAAEFERMGVPASMIFVRNDRGSHNPDEAMDIADFALGVRLLAWKLAMA
ncbi:MAG: hydantoinase/carbamoylase family amidase [Rhodospirillaceae bacterium]|jgi:N-carbamoyl-L-amino-acid hydrolase